MSYNSRDRDPLMPTPQLSADDYSLLYERHRKEVEDFATSFIKKRDDDLNVTLIVAGLFSAVTATFIVYIHPQLQPDPSEGSEALLRFLAYKADNTAFGGDVPQLPSWNGPPPTVVAALVLLYIGLATIAASVVFAILAKQLLNLYALASVSGSDTEGAQSKRRKLRWFAMTLHIAVFLLSSLLQLALLFVSCGIIVYIWKISPSIAATVLVPTVFLFPIYCLFVVLGFTNIGISHIWEGREKLGGGFGSATPR